MSRVGRFETEVLTQASNLPALLDLPGQRRSSCGCVRMIDMPRIVRPYTAAQQYGRIDHEQRLRAEHPLAERH